MTPEQKRRIERQLRKLGMAPGMTVRAAGMRLQPDTFDADTRSARFVATTEKPATVWDWERWDFVEEILRADGMELPDSGQVVLLDAHNRGSVGDVLGSATDFRDCETSGERGKDCLVTFSSVRAAQDAAKKVEERHLTDVSVGYEVKESYFVPEGEKQIIGGREYEGPVKVSTRWRLRELSLVPIGADSLAKVRALAMEAAADSKKENPNDGGNDMNEKLRKFLEARGLDKDATDEQALAYMRELADKNDQLRAEIDQLKDSAPEPVDPKAAARAERQRINGITEAVTVAGLGDDFARQLIDDEVTLDEARAMIFDKLKERNKPLGAGARVDMGTDERDKFRSAATDGLLLRTGMRVDKPADGASEFRGASLLDIARRSLDLAGINTRGMSRKQLAARALSPASSSDFPALMADVTNKQLVKAYTEWPATWKPFVAVTDATDFKELHAIRLSGSPDLLDLDENGEYRTASFSDAQETYRVVTKGRTIRLTRVMLINDDLRALSRIPRLFGTAARRMESAAVYSLITSNPAMSDGNTLFSADHNNLASAGAALSTTALSEARAAMRKQVGMAGERLDITPAFLLVPVVKETDAEVLLRSTALPEDNKSAGVYNPWAGKLTPIADPLLDDASTTAYYLLAHPDQVPTIEVAYLEGEQQPYVEDELDFDSDSLKIKVRHDFGAGLVDWVGIYKNPGA